MQEGRGERKDWFFFHVPYWNRETANKLMLSQTVLAIKTWSQEFLQKKSGEAIWTSRFEVFKKFGEQMKGSLAE